jgi:hypothetical protein
MLSEMNDLNNKMDKIFRDRLADYQQQPPEEIWDGIKTGIGKKPRYKILVPLWQVAAGAALLITAGSLFYYINRSDLATVAENLKPVLLNNGTPAQTENPVPSELKQDEISVNSKVKQSLNSKVFQKDEEKTSQTFNFQLDKIDKAENLTQIKPMVSNPEIEKTRSFSLASMTESYLRTVQPDIIPRKNNTFTPSWDMLNTNEQLITDEGEKNERLFLTAQVSPTYSYRDIGKIGSDGNQQFNQYESGRISYSGGLQFGYKTSGRLSIHAGMMYAQLGYNINQVEILNGNAIASNKDIVSAPKNTSEVFAIKNSIGKISRESDKSSIETTTIVSASDISYNGNVTSVVPPVLKTGGKVEQYFQYLELPFILRYRIIDRKLGVNLLGGLSTNILIGNHASLTIDNETSNIGSSQNIRNFNYMGNLGLGFDYFLRKNLLFSIEPQFKYFLNSINSGDLANRPYILGMFTGVRFMW